ncbi:MAG: hypothetical protein Q9180_004416 [Flavoplaca navasiana]
MSQLDLKNQNLDDWEEIYQIRFDEIIWRNGPLELAYSKSFQNTTCVARQKKTYIYSNFQAKISKNRDIRKKGTGVLVKTWTYLSEIKAPGRKMWVDIAVMMHWTSAYCGPSWYRMGIMLEICDSRNQDHNIEYETIVRGFFVEPCVSLRLDSRHRSGRGTGGMIRYFLDLGSDEDTCASRIKYNIRFSPVALVILMASYAASSPVSGDDQAISDGAMSRIKELGLDKSNGASLLHRHFTDQPITEEQLAKITALGLDRRSDDDSSIEVCDSRKNCGLIITGGAAGGSSVWVPVSQYNEQVETFCKAKANTDPHLDHETSDT